MVSAALDTFLNMCNVSCTPPKILWWGLSLSVFYSQNDWGVTVTQILTVLLPSIENLMFYGDEGFFFNLVFLFETGHHLLAHIGIGWLSAALQACTTTPGIMYSIFNSGIHRGHLKPETSMKMWVIFVSGLQWEGQLLSVLQAKMCPLKSTVDRLLYFSLIH